MNAHGALVVLAAGASRRMGRPKALLPWGPLTFVQHLCRMLEAVPALSRAVVTRAELATRLDISWPLWINPDPEPGMLTSLQTAIRHLPEDAGWMMVALVDQPAIDPATFLLMAAQARPTGWSSPVHQGRRGHPVVIGRQCFADLLAAPLESSPRDVLSVFPRQLVEVDDPGVALDFDTPEEWQAYLAGQT